MVSGNSNEVEVSEAKVLKGKYEAKLQFPEGWGGGQTVKKQCLRRCGY